MSDAFMDDPHFDPDDIASVLFGVASEPAPFRIPGTDDDDGETTDLAIGRTGEPGSDDDNDGYDHISRYVGHGYKGDGETERVSGNGDTRQGGRDRRDDADRALRAAREAGTRNIRRASESHSGSNREGHEGRVHEGEPVNDSVSESIRDAGVRLRTEQADPDSRDSALVAHVLNSPNPDVGAQNRPALTPLTRTTSQIKSVPRFKHTKLQAQMMGMKANVNGEWLLTLKIPQECFDGIQQLNGAFGLELDVEIERRPIVTHHAT